MREWVDIEGFEGLYLVSNYGEVKSTKSGSMLKPQTNTYGYKHVRLSKNGKGITTAIHTLVGKHFIENVEPSIFTQINHIDEDKTNNKVDNLEWCTPSYNTNYSQARVVLQLLDDKVVKEWESTREAGRNGFNRGHVASCCRGERKTHKGFNWEYKLTTNKQ